MARLEFRLSFEFETNTPKHTETAEQHQLAPARQEVGLQEQKAQGKLGTWIESLSLKAAEKIVEKAVGVLLTKTALQVVLHALWIAWILILTLWH